MPATDDPLPADRVRRARRRLLAWYDRSARDLPWRRTSDPYAIWISEVMLQQTRVPTVRERWPLFLAAFPDVHRLAAASEEAVLKAWEGLGYYSRARNLRKAAREIVDAHAGELPDSVDALKRLPGFGAYTAAAVGSIAFGRHVAVVDGNVRRVLARYLDEGGDLTRTPASTRIAETADCLASPRRPGDWNQAVMELGATVCVPSTPKCALCPLEADCDGKRNGRAGELPYRRPRKAVPHHDQSAGIVWRGDRLLVVRRPSQGLLGGLWELPGAMLDDGEEVEAACVRGIRASAGVRVTIRKVLGELDHAYSHFRITLHVLEGVAPRGGVRARKGEDARFVEVEELTELPFARAHRRALELFLER